MSDLAHLKPGETVVVTWEANSRGGAPIKSNRINSSKSPKIVLPSTGGARLEVRPGETWVCRIERITNPGSRTKGAIVVVPMSRKVSQRFEGVWVDPNKAQLIAIVLQNQEKNLMLEGDQGVGKSTIARAIAEELGWEFRKISGGLIKKFNFMLGRNQPSTTGGALSFSWVDSPLVKAIRQALANPEQTFLIMVDEYTRIDEDARDALLDIIEGKKRELSLPNGETIRVPRNVHFMAAGNVGDGFTIRREDAAAKDRWVIVKIVHMPQPEELAHCLRKFPGCPSAEMDRALTVINKLRAVRNDAAFRLSKTVSTRASENVAMFLANGVALPLTMETAVVNQFAGNQEDTTSEAGRVAKFISEELNIRRGQ